MHIRALVPSKYCPNSFARMALLRWSVSSATASVRFFASSTRLYDIKAQDPRSSLRVSDLYGPLSGAALRLSAAFGMLFRHYVQPQKLYIIGPLCRLGPPKTWEERIRLWSTTTCKGSSSWRQPSLRIRVASAPERPPVILLSNVRWDALWEYSHALATLFASAGYPTVFVETTGMRNTPLDTTTGRRVLKRLLNVPSVGK